MPEDALDRDIDNIRWLIGERKLNYFGFSYGTFLGATYASMFPHHYRAMLLDGPIDGTEVVQHPYRQRTGRTMVTGAPLERAGDGAADGCVFGWGVGHGSQEATARDRAAPGSRYYHRPTDDRHRVPRRAL